MREETTIDKAYKLLIVPQSTFIKNEFDQTNDIYPVTPTHLGTKNQLTVKSKISGFMKKWHVSIFYNNVVQNTYVVCPT